MKLMEIFSLCSRLFCLLEKSLRIGESSIDVQIYKPMFLEFRILTLENPQRSFFEKDDVMIYNFPPSWFRLRTVFINHFLWTLF